MKKYTFLLPAYKGKYLDQMLQSIQEQTYENFKVLISDDCSPEDLYSICKPYLDDPRFSFRRNDKNIGGEKLVDHWNLLLEMCDTDYCIMASDDDVYDEHFLEEIDKLAFKYPNVDLLRSRVLLINGENALLAEENVYKEHVNYLDFLNQCHNNNSFKCIANYVFKTSILKNKGGFVFFPFAWPSDTANAMMMAQNGCANTQACLFKFRHSGINISNSKNGKYNSLMKVKGMLQFDVWFNKLIESINVKNSYERYTLNRIIGIHKSDVVMVITYDIADCGFVNFVSCIRQMKKQKLDIANTVLYFIKKNLYRITH